MPLRKMFLATFLITSLISCKKDPGDGGLASIEGSLYYNTYSPGGAFVEKIPAASENVYLTYGDNDFYDDRNDTESDGTFQFKGLQKGEYTVSTFSDCISCSSGMETIELSVEITSKKGTASAGEIIVTKNLDYNDGAATISGLLMEEEYSTSPPIVVIDSYAKLDEFVYIVYGNDSAYFDRVKTDGSGVFQFTELLKGAYTVYTFSDCATCTSGKETREVVTSVASNGQAINVGTIIIDKR